RALGVALDAPAGDDAPQVEPLAQLPPRLVQLVAEAEAARVWVDVDVGAVEAVALRVVAVEVAPVRDPRVGVLPEGIAAEVHDEGGVRAEDLAPHLGDELPLGEEALVVRQLPAVPHHVLLEHGGEAARVERDEARDVGALGETHEALPARRAETKEFHLDHAATAAAAPHR